MLPPRMSQKVKKQQKHAICEEIDLHVILITLCEPYPMVRLSNLIAVALRTVANGNGCRLLRTVATAKTTLSEHDSNLQTSRGKPEPFATHSGKFKSAWFALLISASIIIPIQKKWAFPTSSTFANCCPPCGWRLSGKSIQATKDRPGRAPSHRWCRGWRLGSRPLHGKVISLSFVCPKFQSAGLRAWHKLGTREKAWSPSPCSCGIDSWWPGHPNGPNGWP